jgi:FKBP-type peptidyl-prolyl cis-trans isomerase FklB
MHAASQVAPADAAYAIGHDVGTETVARLKADGVGFAAEDLVAGFRDAVLGADPRIDESTRRQMLAMIERDVVGREVEQRRREDPVFAALLDANLQRSNAFHAAFGRQDGVVTIDGGTQFRVITRAEGPVVGESGTVVASYELRLVDGTVVAREERRELQVQYMFPGARAALRRMPAGSVWEVAIPPSQALGAAGDPPLIGPNETLIATVSLHEVR